MATDYDFLIVGQGIAGSLLATFLLKKQAKILVIDDLHRGASSAIAAGLINPITGKRLVKSWRVEEFLPFAEKTYCELARDLNTAFFQKREIVRLFKDAGEENAWLSRAADPLYRNYFTEKEDALQILTKLNTEFGFGQLKNGAQTDLPLLIKMVRKLLLEKQILVEEKFDYQAIGFEDEVVFYQNQSFKKLIFCEGAAAANNPFFNYLPFQPSKGEALVVKIHGLKTEKILKKEIAVIPIGDEIFWVGSTNSWAVGDTNPTPEMQQELAEKLADLVRFPFQIIEHRAAIRPTVKDRRPFLGSHPRFKNLLIFNGLGTKGALLAPFFANQMAEFLAEGKPLEQEVDIARFK